MASIGRGNPVLDLARQHIEHAKLDQAQAITIDRHSLKGSHGPAESAQAQEQNARDVRNAVRALRRDGFEVSWSKATGPTGIHTIHVSWQKSEADGMPVNAASLGRRLASKPNPVLDLATQAIAHAKLDQLLETSIERHSLKGSRGPKDSAATQSKNLEDVKNAVAALEEQGYQVAWQRAKGPTGIHRVDISWFPQDAVTA
ncbi:MAG: hypothetical protein HY791_37485 [Deltaproteobacteria bacterium]|nr:hypothetical protein [Deltaproteobacteria bacterium]